MKKTLFTLLLSAGAALAQAQSSPAVHRAATAPDRPAQSARADLCVQDKASVAEAPKDRPRKTATKPRRKKSCGNGKCCRKA